MTGFLEVLQACDEQRILIPINKIMCISKEDTGAEIILSIFENTCYVVHTLDGYEELKMQLAQHQ